MIKRNIAIFILILIIIIAFAATISIFIFGKKDKENSPAEPNGVKATIKISDVIDEAVYMGAFSSETPIFADEPFSAKETLRSALAKSNGVPEAALIKIDDFNIDDLSIFFDDGRTMRTLSQSGNTNVMIVAAVSQHNDDVYYAYNVEISVGESKTPRETAAQITETDISGSALTLITTTTAVTTTEKSWGWNNSWNYTTTPKKAAFTTSKPKNSSWVTTTKTPVTTEDKEDEDVTTAPSVTEPPVTDPPAPPETDPPAPPETDPPAPSETDPPAPPETDPPAPPETDPPAPPETDPPAPPENDPPAPPENEQQPAG